jgi:hypothetical protein
METVNDQVQFAPLLDRLFMDMEASAQFEIRCTIKKTAVGQWPPSLEILSVNGFVSLKEYQMAMIGLYMQLVHRFMRTFNMIEPNRRNGWYGLVLEEGLGFVERQIPKVDVFKKTDLPDGKSACTCFFNSAICYIDNELVSDPMLVLQALLKTNLYARAWYKLIKAVSAMLTCACCMTLPASHPASVCSTPEGQGKPGSTHCHAKFLDSMVLAFEENEITRAQEHGEPPEQRINAFRKAILQRNMNET